MRTLIIGANNVIGYNIIKKLLDEEKHYPIMAIAPSDSNLQGVVPLLYKMYYVHGLVNILPYRNFIKDFNPELVIFNSWWGENSLKDKESPYLIDRNITPLSKLINTIGLSNPKTQVKFIGIGSVEEYGDHKGLISEEFIEKPKDLPSICKFTFKQISKYYCDKNNINWNWVRPFQSYEEKDIFPNSIPTLIKKLINHEDIKLNKKDILIDYFHIDDFTESLFKLTQIKTSGIFNFCSGNQYYLKDIIDKLRTLTHSKSKILYNQKLNKSDYLLNTCGDNNKLVKTIKYSPLINVDEGLLKEVKLFQKNI